MQRQLDEQLAPREGDEANARNRAVALLGAALLRAAAEEGEEEEQGAAATVLRLLLRHAAAEHNWLLAYLASVAPTLALRCVARWTAAADTLTCVSRRHRLSRAPSSRGPRKAPSGVVRSTGRPF